mmetsp:Transcript_40309/g.94412  ORF Transcript_40309/g.94412 Transcript_40309/m.94412 type:complete len:234 (+) Transcript_40309:3151-3852(+)
MLHSAEVGCTAKHGIDHSSSAVMCISHNSIADDVELQLHVASRRTTACQKVVEAAEDECFTISGNLQREFAFSGVELEDTIHGRNDHEHSKIGQCCQPCAEIDVRHGPNAVHPDKVEGLVLHFRKQPPCIAHCCRGLVCPGHNPPEDCQRQQQAQRHHDGGIPDVKCLAEIEGDSDEGGSEELPGVEIAELERVVEHLVADTGQEGLGNAVRHVADVSGQLQLAEDGPDDGQQ